MSVLLEHYGLLEGNGMYLTWDRFSGSSSVDHYRVLYSTHIDGTYSALSSVTIYENGAMTESETVPWPNSECIDQNTTASIQNYYKIQAEDVSDAVIATSPPMWGQELLLRASLAYEMDPFLRVPVYAEDLMFINEERTIGYTASWGPWNYFERPRVQISRAPITTEYVTGSKDAFMILPQQGTTNLVTQVTPSGVTSKNYASLEWYPDYNGRVYFVDNAGDPVSIDWYDHILVDYNFQAFTTRELNDCLFLAAGEIVSRPGIDKTGRVESYGTIGNFPRRWDYALVAGASYWLLRRLSIMLLQRERRLVFLDPDGKVPDVSGLMREYRDQFKENLENIAIESRPTIAANVTPEYMMPGQRSRFFRLSFKGY